MLDYAIPIAAGQCPHRRAGTILRRAVEPLGQACVLAPTNRRNKGRGVQIDEAKDPEAGIEQTQKALRDSIEQTKRLSEEAEKLVQQNRQNLHGGDRDEG
jgi:hypothetical protein